MGVSSGRTWTRRRFGLVQERTFGAHSTIGCRMRLTRREVKQLCALVVLSVVLALSLQSERSLGQNVGDNLLARAVGEDQSSPAEGSPAADLTLVVFTDYRCPACRAAHPAMKRAVATDGKVRIVYKDWPLFGAASERAAQIAIASEFQGIYPLVYDRLMSGRTDSEDALRNAVRHSGGNWRHLQGDLASNRTLISAQLARNKRQAFELGLPGTPGYLIGPILVRGALTEAEFTRVFREAREAS
nr:thioredoxin domain-containing protein [uncultured Sphingosinicella sp.]